MSRSFFKNPSRETDVSFNKCFIMLFQIFIHAQIDRGGGSGIRESESPFRETSNFLNVIKFTQ